MNNQHDVKQMNLVQVILYHLLPGVPMLLIALVFASPTWGLGLPITLSLMSAAAIGLLPTLWAILYMTARRQGKRIRDIIGFMEKMTAIKTIGWAVPCVLFSLFVFIVIAPIEHPLWTIFNWVPDWFRIDRFDPATSKGIIWTLTILMNFAINGSIGPFMEEVYFRGFLLPRMNRFGKAAPILNAVLFSLYHLFTPWENISRILALVPAVYIVWAKKNIRIGILFHCLLNTLSCIAMLFS